MKKNKLFTRFMANNIIFERLFVHNQLLDCQMQKFLITFVLIVTIFPGIKAQDKIVTWKNDTIECRIDKNGKRFVNFRISQSGVTTYGKLEQSEIKQLIINDIRLAPIPRKTSFKNWRIELSGGPAFLLDNSDEAKEAAMKQGLTRRQADDYYKQIMQGWQGSGNIHYYFNSWFAAGINNRFFTSGADVWATIDPHDGVHLYYGKMKETMYMHYMGGSLLVQPALVRDQKLRPNVAVSAGMAFFRDEASVLESNLLIKGKAFGFTAKTGLEYFSDPRLSVGLSSSLFYSKIKKITVNNGQTSTTIKLDKNEREDMTSLDISAGFTFYF